MLLNIERVGLDLEISTEKPGLVIARVISLQVTVDEFKPYFNCHTSLKNLRKKVQS